MKFLEAILGLSKVAHCLLAFFGLYIDKIEEWLNS
jgi:hypothetical protein